MNRHLYHEQPSGLPHHPIPNFQVLQKPNVTYLSFNFLLIICIHTAPWLTIDFESQQVLNHELKQQYWKLSQHK